LSWPLIERITYRVGCILFSALAPRGDRHHIGAL
jgi:hypothetical protein